MKIKDYIKKLEALAKKYPNASVIYSRDDEGNGFEPVTFAPVAGRYEHGQFEGARFEEDVNVICIN